VHVNIGVYIERGVVHCGLESKCGRKSLVYRFFPVILSEKGLHVPQIYAVSEDRKVYLQEDLGTQTLLDVVGQERKGNSLSEHSMQLYRKSLSELLRFQLIGGRGTGLCPLCPTSCIRPAVYPVGPELF